MIIIRNAESDLLIRELCGKCSFRADENTGVYMVFEDARPVGNCIYKLIDKKGMVVFADRLITDNAELSDLTLRTVTDYMMRNGAESMVSYAAFPEAVYRSVGFTVTEKGATLELTGFTLGHCCGQNP